MENHHGSSNHRKQSKAVALLLHTLHVGHALRRETIVFTFSSFSL